MAKKQISTIKDKLAKVSENFSVNMYDNGFMFEIGGRNSEGEWRTAKIMCATVDQLVTLIKEATEAERDE